MKEHRYTPLRYIVSETAIPLKGFSAAAAVGVLSTILSDLSKSSRMSRKVRTKLGQWKQLNISPISIVVSLEYSPPNPYVAIDTAASSATSSSMEQPSPYSS